jgi:hypothetical protein
MTSAAAKKRSMRLIRAGKIYGGVSGTLLLIVGAYVALIVYPQPLFAYSRSYDHGFQVYSRSPIPAEMQDVLSKAEQKLQSSPIYSSDVSRRLYLTGD